MKLLPALILIFCLSVSQTFFGQTFADFTPASTFTGAEEGTVTFADVDGDMDMDVLVTGTDGTNEVAKLYINDGMGVFTEKAGTPFTPVDFSDAKFADVDGDMDMDVLIIGADANSDDVAKLYTNDGMGVFSEKTGTPFTPVSDGRIAFANVDGDMDMDVMIIGADDNGDEVANLYTNDGMGGFTLKAGTPFTPVDDGDIAFADVDGDMDMDLLLTGSDGNGDETAKLFTNDGMGVFTEKTGTPFPKVDFSAIAFADVDGDMDMDVLITGSDAMSNSNAKLYTNDGMGVFTEKTGTNLEGVDGGAIAFADVEGDGDQDVVITGSNNMSMPIAKLFTNDGMGVFTEVAGTPFSAVENSAVAFADVNGDNALDLMIAGIEGTGTASTKLYKNTTPGVSIDFQPFDQPLGAFYPNPTNGNVSLDFVTEQHTQLTFTAFDLTGRNVATRTVQAQSGLNTLHADFSSLNPGIYSVLVSDGVRAEALKLIIK